VAIETTEGRIEMLIERDRVPKVAAWFFGLVATGSFDETQFFRVGHLAGQPDRPRFIEGGMLSPYILGQKGNQPRTAAEAGVPLLRDWETTADSGLRHTRGSVSFARDIFGDGSVAPDFVITMADLPEFDHGAANSPGRLGFPVIGYVVKGMDVVDRIGARPRDGRTYIRMLDGQLLSEPVALKRVRRIRRRALQR